MKRLMTEKVCCPVCRGALTLKVDLENEVEVLEGFLTCGGCRQDYVITNGVLDLMPHELKK